MNGSECLSIENIDGKGRGAIAKKSFKKGEVVLRETAYSFVVSTEYQEYACAICGITMEGTSALALSDTDLSRFCSVECISKNYEKRLLEMRIKRELIDLKFEGSLDPLHLITRIAISKSLEVTSTDILEEYQIPLSGEANSFAHILSLEASKHHSIEIEETILNISRMILKICQQYNISILIEHIHHLLLAIQCNAHRVVNENDFPIGLGLYPMTSMLNHSCHSNCVHSFIIQKNETPIVVMQALEDIEEGSELTYSYVKLYQTTAERQQLLQNAYGFLCKCPRCNNNNDSFINLLDPISASLKTTMKELNTCVSLLNKDDKTSTLVIKKLINILSSPLKISEFHPFCRILFHCYIEITRSAYKLLGLSEMKNDASLQKIVVGFGFLALSCSYFVIGRIMPENFDIINILVDSLSFQDSRIEFQNIPSYFVGILEELLYVHANHENVRQALHIFATYIQTIVIKARDDSQFDLLAFARIEIGHYICDAESNACRRAKTILTSLMR